MDCLIASIRYAARSFRASPVFTGAAVLTLALGIGGTTAIFTLIDAVMLRSLPVPNAGRLYRIGDGGYEGIPGRWGFFPFPLYERLKAAAPEFEDITAFDWGGSLLSVRRQGAGDAAAPVRSQYVTGTYFSTLGVRALIGRVFGPGDDRPSAPPVVVLSHHVWKTAYGADASVVGSTFVVEGHPFSVIGVAAPGFFGETVRPDPPDLWIPLQQEPMTAGASSLLHQSISPWLFVVGRLRPDASTTGMAPRLTNILRQWIQDDDRSTRSGSPNLLRDIASQTVAVVPAGAGVGVMKERYSVSLRILLAICGLVLLIACANVAHLLLARAAARRTQTAVRLAIGATRRQIVAEALAESALLAAAGGGVGLLIAIGAARLLLAIALRGSFFVPIDTTPSLAVLAFTSGLALVTGIVFGAAPAWAATRTDPIDALRGSGRTTGDRSSRARTAMLIVQATLSVVLVALSTMLARSVEKLEHQDFGVDVDGRVLIGLKRLPGSYTLEQLSSLYRDIQQRLARLPGVRGSGLSLTNPLTSTWTEPIFIAGHPPTAGDESAASWNRVSAGYLENLGLAVERGRTFTAADNETSAPVAVVNEAFVRRFFRNDEDALDRHFGIRLAENAGTFRIVGIVRDVKFARSALPQAPRPMFYVPLAQRIEYQSDAPRLIERLSHFVQGILLVTDAAAGELDPLIRRTLADADPNLTVTSVRTLRQQIDLVFDRERAVATLAQLFGMIALVLAAVGVYGVTAYLVARQTTDIGVRMALGADRARVIQMVLRVAFQRAAAGLLVGLPLACGAARLMAAQLYGVSFWDPFALAVAAGSLAASTFLAAIIPATRAAAISPLRALRYDG